MSSAQFAKISQQMLIAPLRGAGHAPLFVWTAAFGIKSAVRRIDSFEALSGFGNGPSNGEIVRLALDHQRISAGREREFVFLWPNDEHF